MDYARRNPVKMVMMVVMPLITGGALHNLLRTVGIKLPAGMGMGGKGGFGGGGGGKGEGGFGVGDVVNIAKMFM